MTEEESNKSDLERLILKVLNSKMEIKVTEDDIEDSEELMVKKRDIEDQI